MGDSEHPDEPSWGHRPGDPEGLERWWTGIEWSEYTREVELDGSVAANDDEPLVEDNVGAEFEVAAYASTQGGSLLGDPVAAPEAPFSIPAYQAETSDGRSGTKGLIDRLAGDGDDDETGWDRNLATMIWIPVLSTMVVLAYLLSGAHMNRHTRSHIAGAINFALSAGLMALATASVGYAHIGSSALAVIWLIVLAGAFASVVYFLASRTSDEPAFAFWIWFGMWLFVGLLVATSEYGVFVFGFLFSTATFVIAVTNAVRGRLGMGAKFFGFPVVPVLSRR